MNAIALQATESPVEEYQRTDAALSVLARQYSGVVYDVQTTEGLRAAKEARRVLRGYRVQLEDIRVTIKAPALERCRLIDSEAKRISAALEALEGPIDAQVKAEEKRKADEKEAREAAERARVEEIQRNIRWFTEQVAVAARLPNAAEVAAVIATVTAARDDADSFGDFATTAQVTKAAALVELQAIMDAAAAREAEAERLRIAREELERQRAQLEREQAAAREKAAQEEREREAEARAAREKALAEVAALREQEARERAERERAEEAARVERALAEKRERDRAAAEQAIERAAEAGRVAEQRRLLEEEARVLREKRDALEREALARELADREAREELEEIARAGRIASLSLREAAAAAVAWMQENGHGEEDVCLTLAGVLERQAQDAREDAL